MHAKSLGDASNETSRVEDEKTRARLIYFWCQERKEAEDHERFPSMNLVADQIASNISFREQLPLRNAVLLV